MEYLRFIFFLFEVFQFLLTINMKLLLNFCLNSYDSLRTFTQQLTQTNNFF